MPVQLDIRTCRALAPPGTVAYVFCTMCGRFTLTAPLEGVRELFGFAERPNLAPRANIAPTQDVLAVRADAQGTRHAASLRWGLVPSWAKDISIGQKLINARGESVADKPSFRAAFRARRCLIPADGFYEWRAEGKAPKQPYRIVMGDGALMAFAGLWEHWRDPAGAGTAIETCTIITTDATGYLRPLHDRMPVILDPADHSAWLDPATSLEDVQALLRPFDGERLRAYPVSRKVGQVANDTPELIEPVGEDLPHAKHEGKRGGAGRGQLSLL